MQDPYGDLLASELASARLASELDAALVANSLPRLSRLGHHGLMHDRLDADTLQPTLVVGSAQAVQNRNRTYLPSLGRFAQGDPLGTSQLVQLMELRLGRSAVASVGRFDLGIATTDGLNRYAYTGSAPTIGVDPLGLFFESIVGLLFSSTTTGELQSDWSQNVADAGVSVGQKMGELYDGYMYDQMMDAAWAMDWSASDDLYSKSAYAGDWWAGARDIQGADGPAMASWRPLPTIIGMQIHHIATKYGAWGRKFQRIFRQNGVGIDDIENLIPVLLKDHRKAGQRGHSEAYHQWVWKELSDVSDAVKDLDIEDRARAFRDKLYELASKIRDDPGIINR